MIPDTLPHRAHPSITTVRTLPGLTALSPGRAFCGTRISFAVQLSPFVPPSLSQKLTQCDFGIAIRFRDIRAETLLNVLPFSLVSEWDPATAKYTHQLLADTEGGFSSNTAKTTPPRTGTMTTTRTSPTSTRNQINPAKGITRVQIDTDRDLNEENPDWRGHRA